MPNEVKPSDELTKSIDSLIDEVFAEEVSKSIDIAQDSKTTADAAIAAAPSMEKDESRGAGRPKQISDVPQVDEDGKRGGEYDASISEEESDKGDEPSETSQSKVMDQSVDSNRLAQKPKAPQSAPFKKSLTESEFAEYLSLKKAESDRKEAAEKAELLKKAEEEKKGQEQLIKSAVLEATASLRKENEELKKSVLETAELMKAMAAQPRQAKSITGIEALEKSVRPEEQGEKSFTKSEILDAAFELVKSQKLSDLVVSEIEMTGTVADPAARRLIEQKLQG